MEEISFTSTRELSAEYLLDSFNGKMTKNVMRNTGICEIESGIDVIDRLSGGIPQKGLMLVTGRDLRLQEDLCMSILSEIIRRNRYRCCMITLSRSHGDVTKSLVSSVSRVPLGRLDAGKLSRNDLDSINRAERAICVSGLKLFESSVMQFTELEGILRKVKEEGYEVVFISRIDSVHDRNLEDGDEAVHIIGKLHSLAHSLKLAVVGLRQASDDAENPGESLCQTLPCMETPADFYDRLVVHYGPEPEKDSFEDREVRIRAVNPFTGSDETERYRWNHNRLGFVRL